MRSFLVFTMCASFDAQSKHSFNRIVYLEMQHASSIRSLLCRSNSYHRDSKISIRNILKKNEESKFYVFVYRLSSHMIEKLLWVMCEWINAMKS